MKDSQCDTRRHDVICKGQRCSESRLLLGAAALSGSCHSAPALPAAAARLLNAPRPGGVRAQVSLRLFTPHLLSNISKTRVYSRQRGTGLQHARLKDTLVALSASGSRSKSWAQRTFPPEPAPPRSQPPVTAPCFRLHPCQRAHPLPLQISLSLPEMSLLLHVLQTQCHSRQMPPARLPRGCRLS